MPGEIDRAIEDHRRDPKPHPRMGLTDTQRAQVAALIAGVGAGVLLAVSPPPAVAYGVPGAVGVSTYAARADHTHDLVLPANLQALAGVSGSGLLSLNPDGSISAGPFTLPNVIIAGSAGAAASVPVITWDAQGRLTAVSSAAITPAAIGALSGTLTAGRVALSGGAGVVTDSASLLYDSVTLTIDNAIPTLQLRESDAAFDSKCWFMQANGGSLYGYIADDANSISSQWLRVDRSGPSITRIHLLPSALGNLVVGTDPGGTAGLRGQVDFRLGLGGANGYTDGTGNALEIGAGQSSDNFSTIDLHAAEAAYPDYALRLVRNSGANGLFEIQQRGTGSIRLRTVEATGIEFWTSNVLRAGIDSSGGFSTANARYVAVLSIASSGGTTSLPITCHVAVLTGTLAHLFSLPATAPGRVLYLKNRSTGILSYQTSGSDTIDGVSGTRTIASGAAVILIANGTDWCLWT